MTLRDILIVFKQHIMFLILFPLICAGCTAAVCWFVLSDEYTSSMAVYVLPAEDQFKQLKDKYWAEMPYTNEFSELYHEIYASQQFANDVAKIIKTDRIKNAVMKDLEVDNLDEYKVEVDSSDKNRVITINVTNSNAENSAKAADSYSRHVKEYVDFVASQESVNIIDELKVPEEPSGPPRLLITVAALFGALLVAITIIFMLDIVSSKIKRKEDLVSEFGYRVLAQIPKS